MKMDKQKSKTGNKNIMKISPSELQKASQEFKTASQETDEMMGRLEKVIKNLEATWEDAGQQAFFRYYQEWHTHVGGISQLLNLTAVELNAIAERYSIADADLPANKAK